MEEEYLSRGEISLAHYGVLYLDEILEFRKETLETLRGPLEDKEVTISRLWASLTYPCNFMLIASMNPCPCGYYGSSIKNCICSPTSIKRYLSKLSGPLLDRIDINVNIQPLEYQNFKENEREFRLQSRRKADIITMDRNVNDFLTEIAVFPDGFRPRE